MPRRAYIADVEKLAAECDIDGVSSIRRVDDDEFRFTLDLNDGSTKVDISALVLPSKIDHFIFCGRREY
jgi:hypothetical protein